MIAPVNAPISQPFGADPATYAQFGMLGHNGIDYAVPPGTPILAPEDGVVIISGNNVQDQYTGAPVAGETVAMKGTYEHWLLHNSSRLVSAGQHVKEGQVIAYSGYTGFVDPPGPPGAHCHHGVRPLNPDLENGYRGFIDQLTIKEQDMQYPTKGDLVNVYNETGWPGHPPNANDEAYWCNGTGQPHWGIVNSVWTDLVIEVAKYSAQKAGPVITQAQYDALKTLNLLK